MANPGGEREQQRGNPVNPYREFARRQAQALGESPQVVRAVVEFTTETFLVDRKIGPPEFHHRQAMKAAKGLSEVEIVHATAIAIDSYNACRASQGEATEDQIQALTPEAVRMWREDAEQRRLVEEGRKRRILRDRLQQSFDRVMELSDDQLRISNANRQSLNTKTPRIHFMENPVYAALRDRRPEFHSRSLTEDMYGELEDQIVLAKDTLRVNIRPGINLEALTTSTAESLMRNRELRERLGGEKFSMFCDTVMRLLGGESVSASEIQASGLDPMEILKTARVKHANFVFNEVDERWAKRLDVRREARKSDRLVWS